MLIRYMLVSFSKTIKVMWKLKRGTHLSLFSWLKALSPVSPQRPYFSGIGSIHTIKTTSKFYNKTFTSGKTALSWKKLQGKKVCVLFPDLLFWLILACSIHYNWRHFADDIWIFGVKMFKRSWKCHISLPPRAQLTMLMLVKEASEFSLQPFQSPQQRFGPCDCNPMTILLLLIQVHGACY